MRHATILSAISATLLLGCATAPTAVDRPPAPPPAVTHPPLAVQTLGSGLRVVNDPSQPGQFVASMLFLGGPINDPESLPGLTEWMVEAATLGTRGRDPVTESPQHRALQLGATLEPIANGAVAGWLVMGPRQESKRLLELLLDVALRPSFPATRMSMAIAMQREALESRDDGVIERAIAIALGQAAGLGRPLHMGPTAGTYERVTLAHTERHWRRIVQPDVGALVLMGSGEDTPLPDAITEGTWDVPALTQEPPAVVCEAQGRTAHLLVTPGSFGEHTIALWAAGAPGWSATDRRALDALTLHLDARQGGPIEGLVGASQARRASPDLVDLGHIAGEPVAAILIGTSGPPEKALADLRKVDSFLAGLGSAQALTEEDAARALRRLMGRRSASMHRPFRNAIARALDALSPPSATPITPDALSATAQMIFAPWRSSIVLVGSTDLREDIEREAPVALWPEDADEPAPASAVRCIAPGAKR